MIDHSTLSDLELIALLRQGQHLAFTQIFNRYNGLLYIYALKVIKDKKEAEDVVQEIFISLWDKRENFELKSSLSAYLFSAVRYKFLDLVAKQKVRLDYTAEFQAFINKGSYSTDDYINEKELESLVEKEVAVLPRKMQEVFKFSRDAGLSHREIAQELSISEKTVRNHINHALNILRLKLGIISFLSILFPL